MALTSGTTSGTVLNTPFNQRKVMDHAIRRAGYIPQKITAEWITITQDLLFLQLSEYVNYGFPLWTKQQLLLPIVIGSPNAVTPYGTVDVMDVYWRTFSAWREGATDTSGTDVSDLVAGEPNDDVTIASPNPGVIVDLGGSIEIDSIGVLPGTAADYTVALELQTSDDGVTFTTAVTLPSTTFQAGVWSYFDLEPTISAPFFRLRRPGVTTWILNQVNFVLAGSSQVNIGKQNIDDYYDLPDKFFQGQPNTAYVDRQRDQPVIKIWPTPNQNSFYNGTIVGLARRYIEDPGSMTDTLEVPARWFEGVVSRLAVRIMDELPVTADNQANPAATAADRAQRRTNNETAAVKAEASFQAEERDKSPIRLTPNISPYTR